MVGNRPLWVIVLLSALICGAASRASAATIVLGAIDQGWYRQNGEHLVANPNYVAGMTGGNQFRNFFVFDLAGLTSIQSAALRLNTEEYSSADPTETYTLFDVTTPIASLINGTGGLGAFDDLGSGTSYGSRVYSLGDEFQVRDLTLNPAALTALNLTIGGLFALGGALTSLDPSTPGNEFVFGFSGNNLARLVLETERDVPEPSTLLLVGAGAAVGLSRRFRRKS